MWYMDTKIKLRSQVNSQVVTASVEGSNARFQGPNAPTKGWFKFELNLKDPGFPTSLPVKYIQPIEIKYQDAALNPVTVQRSVTPGLSSIALEKYELWLKISVRADGPDGPAPWGPAASDVNLKLVVRCDVDTNDLFAYRYGTGNKGCVNAGYWPTVIFPASGYPYIGDNIRTGQGSGSPGAPNSNNPLHRVSTAQRTANYLASCGNAGRVAAELPPEPVPTPEIDEWQCDEYPFASTQEGGALARMKWVPRAENGNQGILLREFYVTYRVILEDPFLVYAPT